jgi:hypothetical protein
LFSDALKEVFKTDKEIDRREFNGHTLVLLEDTSRGMRKKNGTSWLYIFAIEKKGKIKYKRYITDLMIQLGYRDARHGAIAILSNPEKFKKILGEDWHGYTNTRRS